MASLAFGGIRLFEWRRKAALRQVLPYFAVGFDVLSCPEYFATVHTGAVVQRNTGSIVILILARWAVTAALAGHAGALEITPKENRSAQGNV